MPRKIKDLGQVYTPQSIVCDILDAAGYTGQSIVKKHVMENSCGPGAFLTEIVDRYAKEYMNTNADPSGLKKGLEKHIHAIDVDEENVRTATSAMDEVASRYGLDGIKWDVNVGDSLAVTRYDGKMDFVVGNPPYVRVHNLNNYDDVKRFSFTQDGMTDIYIAFFEVGLNMLKKGGVLSYITPSSYYNSLAATVMREYIGKTQSLSKIMDLGHYNPFDVTTYTTITCFKKGVSNKAVEYWQYDPDTGVPSLAGMIPYDELFVDGNIVLIGDDEARKEFSKIYAVDRSSHQEIKVKNGFATLADSVFFSNEYDGLKNTIRTYKSSTGKWTSCIYPYDEKGKLIPFDELDPKVQKILRDNEGDLLDRNLDKNAAWYSFGRTQAINDVQKEKIGINALYKDKSSVKVEIVPPGSGVYGGLYILSEYPLNEVEKVLRSDDFIEYVKSIKKYKNGGYYTLNTEDLNKYLLYKLCNVRNTQSTLPSFSGT